MRTVWLVRNGDYWRAFWRDKGNPNPRSKSLGNVSKLSRRQARLLCKRLENETDDKPAGPAPRVSAWIEQYVTSRTDVGDSTRALYRDCGVYLRAHFEDDPPINTLTRADAADWHDALAAGRITAELNASATGRKWNTPTLSTVRKHVRTAKLIFSEAASRDLILFNPFDRLKGAPPKPLKTWREVTPADMVRIFAACPNQDWRALFGLCRFAALRVGEALELQWCDVLWDGNRINVNEGIDKETTKRRYRTCPIEPARCPTGLTALLREAFEAAPDGSVRVCEGVPANNVRRTALGILRRSGVGRYAKPFHTLRKCRISELAQHFHDSTIEAWAGHDAAVSRRHYQRVPEELYALPSIQNGGADTPKQRRTTAGRKG